ncbi:MAG: hypothetical protein ACFB6S_10980, partial [Geminicoccaceae bacterium]
MAGAPDSHNQDLLPAGETTGSSITGAIGTTGEGGEDEANGLKRQDESDEGAGFAHLTATPPQETGLPLLAGTDGKDKLIGGSAAQEIVGLASKDVIKGFGGDDIIRPGLDKDYIKTGKGDDWVLGTAVELDQDHVADFSGGDRILVEGAQFSADSATLTESEGSFFLAVDLDGDGVDDLSVKLTGDLIGVDIAAAEGGTVLSVGDQVVVGSGADEPTDETPGEETPGAQPTDETPGDETPSDDQP